MLDERGPLQSGGLRSFLLDGENSGYSIAP